jgi:hypothetical protein
MDYSRCIVHDKDGEQKTFDVGVKTKSKQDDRTEPAAGSKSYKPGGRKGVFPWIRSRFQQSDEDKAIKEANKTGRENSQRERLKLQGKLPAKGGGRTKGRLTNKNKRRSRKYKKTASHRKKSSRRRDIRRSHRRIH